MLSVDAGGLAVAGREMDGVLHNCKSVTNALSVGRMEPEKFHYV